MTLTFLSSVRAGPWSMKLFYLLYYAAAGIYLPYVALYLHAIGLDGSQIGLVSSVVPLVGMALQPLWGTLSDRYGWRKRLLVLSPLTAALAAPTVALAHSFGAILPLVVVLAIALGPSVPLADATTLEWLRRRSGSYGGVRVYGSLGFLLASVVVGPFYAGRHILLLFPFYGLLLFVTFLVSLTAPRQDDGVVAAGRWGVLEVLHDRVVVVFLLLATIGYGTYAAYNTFYALYLKGLGAGTGVIGIASGLSSLSELPVMALAGLVIGRVGVKPLLLAGLGAAVVRWAAYGLLTDYHVAILFQLLHGLSFAGFYVAGVTFVDHRVAPHLRATGQTLFNGATFGLGTVAGANIFGALLDQLHASGMYLTAAGVCAVAVVGMALFVPNLAPKA